MNKLFQYRRDKRDVLDKAKALVGIAEKENRDFTFSEQAEYDRYLSEADKLSKKIENEEKLDEQFKTCPAENMEISAVGNIIDGNFSQPSKKGWIDQNGNPVKVYGHKDKAGNGQYSVGKYVKGLLTGNWIGAENELKLYSSTTTNNAAGAFAIPVYLHSELIDLARANSVLSAAGANIVDLKPGQNKILRVTADPTAEVKVELESANSTSPTFDLVEFTPYTIMCYCQISQELAMDAANFSTILEQVMSAAVGTKLDYLGLYGNGTGQPTGIINTTGINTVSVDSFDYDNILDGINECQKDNCYTVNSYIVSPSTNNVFAKLKETNTGAYLQAPEDVKNLQKLITTSMADSDLLVGSFDNLYLGLRQGATFEISPIADDSFRKFGLAFRIVMRADWQVIRPNHFCLCSQNVS